MGVVSAIASVAAVGVSIYGQVQAAAAQEANARFQTEVAQRNKQLAEQSRDFERKQDRRKFRVLQGSQFASSASSGTSGFEDIFQNDILTFETEQLIKDFNVAVTSFKNTTEAAGKSFEARQLASSNRIGALTSGLEGVKQGVKLVKAFKASNATQLESTTTLGGSN